MSTRLNVLIVEDSESDAELVIRQLEKAHYEVKFERVETPDQMKRALKKQEWDVVLSDHKLPHFSSVAALSLLNGSGLDIPFIVISGTIGEETAVELMKAGAHDYIMKDNLKRLFPAIDRELKEAKIRREHRLTEDALQESEKKYRDLVDNALVGVFRTSLQGDILYVNQAMWKMFEFGSAEEMMRERLLNRYKNPIERQHFLERLQMSGSVDGFELEVLTKTGHTKNVVISATLNDNLASGMIVDITARRRAEEDLAHLFAWQDAIFEGSRDAIFVSDADSRLVSVNQAACLLSGYSKEELLRLRIPDLHEAEDLGAYELFHDRIMGGEEILSEANLRQKGGGKIFTEFNNKRVMIDGVAYMHTTGRDITERKQAEKQVSLLAHTVKSIIECVSITDLENTVLFVNEAFLTTYGYDEQELLGKNIEIVESPNNPPELLGEILAATLRGGWHGELLNRTKDGREFPVSLSTSFVRDDTGRAIALVGVATDITERKRAEEELEKSEGKFRAIFDNASDGMILVDLKDRKFFESNATCAKMLGYAQEEFPNLDIADIHPQEDLPFIYEQIGKFGRGEKGIRSDIRFKRKDGSIFPADLSPALLTIAEKKYLLILFKDITERKQAELALCESQALFASAFRNSPVAMQITAVEDSKYVDANEIFLKDTGYTRDEVIGRTPVELGLFIDPADREALMEDLQAKGSVYNHEIRLRIKSGTILTCLISVSVITMGGRPHLLASILDISDRKRAEEALLYERGLLRAIMDYMPDHVYFKDKESRFLRISRSLANAFGLDHPGQAVGKTDFDFFAEGHARPALDAEQEIMKTGIAVVGLEERESWPDGRETWVLTTKVPLQDARGEIIGTFGISRDITGRKRAEAALSASELRFRSVWDNSADGMRLTDSEGSIIAVNEAYCELVKISREQLVGEIFSKIYKEHGSDDGLEVYHQRFAEGKIVPRQSAHIKLWNDKELDAEISNSFLTVGEGETILLSIVRDVTEQTRAEKHLHQERTLLRTIIDAIPDEICVKDTERRFLLVNPGTLKAFKLSSADDIIGKKDEDLMPEQFAQAAREEEESVFATGRPSIDKMGSTKINPMTGEIERSILKSKIPLLDESGKLTGLVGINRDVTELKRAEDMLEKERTLLLTLIESIPDEVSLKDLRHRFLVANRASMTALGVASPQALIGKTDEDFMPTEMAREHFAEEDAILETGNPLFNRERIKTNPKTGEIDRCLLTTKVPVKDQAGKTIGILSINRYITERRKAEEALRASEEKFRALFEESKDVVYISTTDGRLLDINPAGIELFGHGSKEEDLQVDLSRHSYVDPRDKERFDREMEKEGFVKDFEVVLRRRDGEKLTVLETATAVRDKMGKIVQYRGIIRDVTNQRLLERQFIQAQKMESIGTLAGGIAHDFNNILGIVLGHLSLLERMREDEAQFKDSISSINKAVQRGASLVRQILTFARKAETQLEPVSINSTIKELTNMLSETFPKTIVLDVKLDKMVPIVSMDPSQLHQALLNLCVNARDAMKGEGTLKITTQLVGGDEVATRFPKARAKDYIRVGVADTGTGMDEETRRQIFEPFFTTKEKGKGTGLGLAVVYGVLQSHDGFIDVESALGVGTTFHLFIPVPEGVLAMEQKQAGKPDDLPRGTETILVVEDEDVLQKLLSQVLEMQGYKVYAANDGEEAVRIFGEHKDEIALVVSDMGLPKRSGWDAFKMMKHQDPDIRVILASGYIDPGQTSEVLKSGVKRFIHKPYRINEVLIAVRETLDAEL